ncbi:hypothetical protein FOA52_016018 [Chlamydomonas sp. UWO 241]|nr:hypothetical protein FOA52_016018 [Chlamydomonas sp. UWO 241]
MSASAASAAPSVRADPYGSNASASSAPAPHSWSESLVLSVMASVFSAHVATADLDEFYSHGRPLPLSELYDERQPTAGFVAALRDALWQVLWHEPAADKAAAATVAAPGTSPPSPAARAPAAVQPQHASSSSSAPSTSLPVRVSAELAESGGRLYAQLYELCCRAAGDRRLAPPAAFHAPGLASERFMSEASSNRGAGGEPDSSARVWSLLGHAPALIPFSERARLFQAEVSSDRAVHYEMQTQGQHAHLQALMAAEEAALDGDHHMAALQQQQAAQMGSDRFVTIRRDHLLDDGFDRLAPLGDALKGRVRVQFINEHGEQEAGVDGGGLFKDFLESLIKEGFHGERGLFATSAANQIYPNPGAFGVLEDAPRMLEFMGRMLGKAVYEGILVELRFASFFLKGDTKTFRPGARCDVNDLPTLDPELYRNLMRLRHFSEGDVGQLSLTFTATDGAFGKNTEVELKPGGRDIPVTADNVMEYIHRMADYRLNQQPRGPTHAFLRGFFALVRPQWVSMFSAEELQLLIGGSEEGIRLDDLRAHVQYAGGYHEDHPVVHTFWEAVASFTPEEQRSLLKFVTSCSRAPLLGFKFLEPQMCIQMAGSVLDEPCTRRLPTAATCMNLLKLPPYRSVAAMREKLLYAVSSGAGFDLS